MLVNIDEIRCGLKLELMKWKNQARRAEDRGDSPNNIFYNYGGVDALYIFSNFLDLFNKEDTNDTVK